MKKNNNVVIVFLITIATLAISAAIHNGTTDVLSKDGERQALLRFKQDLKDPTNRLSNWVVDGDCCSWTGVACDNLTGHVRELHLGNPYDIDEDYEAYVAYKLGGKINPSLLNLNYLNYLDLSGNDFEGIPIPSFIGSLKSSTHLDLSNAGFRGLIPHQLGNLSCIRYLNLEGSELKVEKLQWISGLNLLQYLGMNGVNMSQANDWGQVLNTLPFLVELHLSSCQLGNISPDLPTINFTSLSFFDVSENKFDILPNWLFSLKNLHSLYLSHNLLGELFLLGHTNMTNSLKILDLSGNRLNSTIPQWLGSLNRLEFLDLSFNELQGNIPASIGNLTSMVSLNLSSNQLEGDILPNWLFSLKNLRSLYLSHNLLGELFLLGHTNMTNSLKILDLSGNRLNSTIPQRLGSLNRLEFLDLSFNELQGDIPASIGNLTSMVSLNLSSNQLEGEIPKSFGNLFRLRELQLSNNKLSGPIPTAIGKLSTLLDFDVSDNHLSGSLPMDIGKLSKLRNFNVSKNQLNGSLPMDIGKLSNLRDFDASNNQLNGSLPESFGQLVKLQNLYISHNSLKGVVHEVHFANLSRLKVLIASGNSLNFETSPNWVPPFQLEILEFNSWYLGPKLPLWLRGQQHLSELQISNAGISDTIPTWFCNISSRLHSLNLSYNQFHGPFQCDITTYRRESHRWDYSGKNMDISSNQFNGSLPLLPADIEFLDFSSNSFSGSVTQFFCDNLFVGNYLFLGNNLLSGAIPKCWEKWETLVLLSLENNNLVGDIPSSMGNLTEIYILNLRDNSLSGDLPLFLRNSTGLSILDLSGNKLNGKIPEWIGMSLSNLAVLKLRSNNFEGDIPLQLCNLASLHVLDLAHNNLSGTIPRCFYNLTAMKTSEASENYRPPPRISIDALDRTRPVKKRSPADPDMAKAEVVTKGRAFEYTSLLRLVKSMDLSGNNLYGEIPMELTSLHLQTLNLSRNHLVGKIPWEIGDMKQTLESLDLSQNRLWGEIPSSISDLSFLSYLNLSCNNLTGSIPTGTQLQSFTESSFIGNHLCGPPLRQTCSPTDQPIPPGVKQVRQEDSLVSKKYLYLSMGLGFAFGFWAILGSLLVNMPWSVALSGVVDRIVLKLYAFIIEKF